MIVWRNLCLFGFVFIGPLLHAEGPSNPPTPPAPDRGVLNRDLPSWLSLGADVRWRGEGTENTGYIQTNDQHYFLQKYRFNVDIRPLSWLNFYGQLQDARVTSGLKNQDGSAKNTLDLHQAYVGIGREDGWWDVKAGRQRLIFGEERLIGAAEWTNSGRVFDAIRLGIHHGSDRVDLFASSVVINDPTGMDHHQQGNNLHGIYGSFGSWIPRSKVEPYVLWHTSPTASSLFNLTGKYESWTYGLRSAGNITDRWLYQGEVIGQKGDIGNYHLSAWTALAQVTRNLGSLPWKPSVVGEYNFASGGRDIQNGTGTIHTFDQLYPTNHPKYGATDTVGRRNMKDIRYALYMHPRAWLTIRTEGFSFWLANPSDALYGGNGSVAVAPIAGGAQFSHIGQEAAVLGEVKISRYEIGARYGHLFPGKYLNTYSTGVGRSFWAAYFGFHI